MTGNSGGLAIESESGLTIADVGAVFKKVDIWTHRMANERLVVDLESSDIRVTLSGIFVFASALAFDTDNPARTITSEIRVNNLPHVDPDTGLPYRTRRTSQKNSIGTIALSATLELVLGDRVSLYVGASLENTELTVYSGQLLLFTGK
jgi:hypothetical protein